MKLLGGKQRKKHKTKKKKEKRKEKRLSFHSGKCHRTFWLHFWCVRLPKTPLKHITPLNYFFSDFKTVEKRKCQKDSSFSRKGVSLFASLSFSLFFARKDGDRRREDNTHGHIFGSKK